MSSEPNVALAVGFSRQVGLNKPAFALRFAELTGEKRSRAFIAADKDDARPFFRQQPHDGGADSRRAACDERDFVFQSQVHARSVVKQSSVNSKTVIPRFGFTDYCFTA